MPEAVIVATARTPDRPGHQGIAGQRPPRRPGRLRSSRPRWRRSPTLDPSLVEDLILGCGQPAGEAGYNIGRVAAILAGMPDVPGVTVNRYCSSSLQTIRMAAHAIKAGEGDVFIAAGVETVSRFMQRRGRHRPAQPDVRRRRGPHRGAQRRAARATGPRSGACPTSTSPWARPPRTWPSSRTSPARRWTSSPRCRSSGPPTSLENGFWEHEITPVTATDAEGNGSSVTQDDGIRAGTTAEGLAELKPVFRPDGKVTAGNACPLNDGAAAVIVMSDTKAAELGITPLARIVSSGVSALNPEIMGLGPIEASRQALARAGMTIDDIDLVEINEAFAAQVIPSARHLGIPWDKLNVNGGAIALGHPFGMTGARIMTTLINGLQDADKTFGLETMCVGGGQGMAMIVERLS